MSVGNVTGDMSFDVGGFIGSVNAARHAWQGLQEDMAGAKPPPPTAWDSFTKSLKDLDHALGVVDHLKELGRAAFDIGREAINMASDWNETTNVMEQAFGSQAGAMEKWADTTANALGRSTQWVRQSSSVLGAMLEPMTGSAEAARTMSKGFTQLAVDLGSFWNVADDDAMAALRSGISGETEPLKKFGIVMTEAALNSYALSKGLNQTTQQMSEAQKTTLRYNFILEHTTKAQGDAARTADGYANTMKALDADIERSTRAIGQQALPAWQGLVVTFRDIMGIFETSDWSGLFDTVAAAVKKTADVFVLAARGALVLAGTLDEMLGGANSDRLGKLTEDLWKVHEALNAPVKPKGAVGSAESPFVLPDFGAGAGAAQTVAMPTGSNGKVAGKGPHVAGSAFLFNGDNDMFKAYSDAAAEVWKDLPKLAQAALDAEMDARDVFAKQLQTWAKDVQGNVDKAKKAEEALYDAQARQYEEEEKARLAATAKMHEHMDASRETLALGLLQNIGGGDWTGALQKGALLAAEQVGKMVGMDAEQLSSFMGDVTTGLAGLSTVVSTTVEMFKTLVDVTQTFIKETVGRFGAAAFGGNKVFSAAGTGVAGAGSAAVAGAIGGSAFGGIPGGVIGGFAGLLSGPATAILELSKETKSYTQWVQQLTRATQPLVTGLEPLWRNLLPFTNIMEQLNVVAAAFLGTLIPGTQVFEQLFNVTLMGAKTIAAAATELAIMANSMGANLDVALIAGARNNLDGMSYAALFAANNMEALANAARSALNVPEAAKVSYQRYLSLRDETGGGIAPDAYGMNRGGDTYIYVTGPVRLQSIADLEASADGNYRNTGMARVSTYRTRRGLGR